MMVNKKFYFVRHGRTEWNSQGKCQGFKDIPLDHYGRMEVEKLKTYLPLLSFTKIVSSPLLRALETAKIIQNHCNYPLEIMDEFKERGWGLIEGASNYEMYRIEDLEKQDLNFIAGIDIENRFSFNTRVKRGMLMALRESTPLIVSHGRVFLALTEILGLPPIKQIPNATVIECNPINGQWHLIFHGKSI